MDTRVLVVPGGTSLGAVAATHAALHKLVELHLERQEDPDHPAPHTVVVVRDPARVAHTTVRGAATTAEAAFPELADELAAHSDLLDDIDLVLETSGSSTGSPHLVGIGVEALLAAERAVHDALGGPGRWILALPCHHVAGVMVLLRAAAHEIPPQIVDTTDGFDPRALLPAIAGATQDPDVPGYLSLVPAQLRACLDAGDEITGALARLGGLLVGGQAIDPHLVDRARELGIRVHTTYGMTETCGGCVHDGLPLPGTLVRALDIDGQSRLAIAGPTLMTRYLDGPSPFIDEAGCRWLVTGDVGQIAASGQVEVSGRADDVIVSGGLSIAPAPVQHAALTAPGVTDAWVLGLPDDKWGQVVAVAVTADPRPHGDEVAPFARSVRDHVGSVVGRVQAPRVVVVLDEMPTLPSGKTDRRAVAAAVERALDGPDAWRR